MSESVNLPALGESVTEGTVTRWLKNVGDKVEVDEPLLEVSTDKVDTEIPSPIAGVLEQILVQEDETVEVGAALAVVGDGSGAGSADATPADAAPAESEEQAPAEDEQPAENPSDVDESSEQQDHTVSPAEVEDAAVDRDEPSVASDSPPVSEKPKSDDSAQQISDAAVLGGSGYVTPLVRRLANKEGVDLSIVTGTGVGGRIRKEDVLEAAKASKPSPAATQKAATSATAAYVALETSPLRGTRAKMSRLRKVVSVRAVESLQSTAQLTTVVEVDVTKVALFRQSVKDEFLTQTGTKLSFLPFFALAATEALKAYPIINATVDGEEIVYPEHENLSIAVDTERGLLTPVVRDASSKDLATLSKEIADLATRTRDNKLKPDELAGGTFTLTNTGSRGALFDTPLVFLPQSAILGTGIVVKKPVVVTTEGIDAISIRSTVYLALSYDHRIVDGADAARFLVAVKNRLESGDFSSNLGY